MHVTYLGLTRIIKVKFHKYISVTVQSSCRTYYLNDDSACKDKQKISSSIRSLNVRFTVVAYYIFVGLDQN